MYNSPVPTTYKSNAEPAIITQINRGDIGIIPTDTVYGLVCAAGNSAAVERLYRAKHREHKPGTLIAAGIDQLIDLGLKARYLKAVADYWPNPLSIVIPCGPGLAHLHRGVGSLAVRIPADPTVHTFLQTSGPLLTTSANMPGEPPATTLAEARAYFGDTVDFYVDGGDLSGRPASTIIRIVDDAVEVLREGAVAIDEAGSIVSA